MNPVIATRLPTPGLEEPDAAVFGGGGDGSPEESLESILLSLQTVDDVGAECDERRVLARVGKRRHNRLVRWCQSFSLTVL